MQQKGVPLFNKARTGNRRWLARYGSVGLLTRFGLLSLIPMMALAIVLAQMLSWNITNQAYDSARERGQLLAQLAVQPLFGSADLNGGIASEQLDLIDARLRVVADGQADEFEVWNRQGMVIYSKDRSVIGSRPAGATGVAAALAGNTEVMAVSGDGRKRSAATGGPAELGVYVPLRLQPAGPPDGAVEVFLPYAEVAAEIDDQTHRLYLVMLAGLTLLYAVMFPIVRTSYSARIRSMENEAQALREHYLAQEAVRGSEAKSRFLASMSHEVRTPLNSILGFAQLLLEEGFGPLNDRQKRYVGHIGSSGQHLLSLINDILDLSKVQAGQMDLAIEDVRVRAVLDDVMARARPLADRKKLELVLEEGPDAVIRADRRRFEQVLWNLLSNAIKFTPAGTVSVSLTTTRRGARLAVQDTGVGIAFEDQSRIFDEFTQLRGSAGNADEGTGLGLALTRQLVELMGGRIAVESSPGQGSTFTVTLPLAGARRQTLEARPVRTAV